MKTHISFFWTCGHAASIAFTLVEVGWSNLFLTGLKVQVIPPSFSTPVWLSSFVVGSLPSIISVKVEGKVTGKTTGAQSWLSMHSRPCPIFLHLSPSQPLGGHGSHIVRMPSAWHSEALWRLCPPQVKTSPELPFTMTGSMWLEDTPFGPTSLWHAFRWEMWLLDLASQQLWHTERSDKVIWIQLFYW